MNRTLKEATVKCFYYQIHQHFRQHLNNFVNTYNASDNQFLNQTAGYSF